MVGNSGALAAVLTVVSVLSLSLLSLLCLRCKRKSKVIHEEHQIYNPQTFQREGSIFAVTRSKTVIRPNQRDESCVNSSAGPADEGSDYENVNNVKNSAAASETGSLEHTYVDPLPNCVYANEEGIIDAEQTQDVYENIPAADDDDYENAEYLEEMKKQEEEEPDYVNENGES